jgi:hypothetical protein
MDVLEYWHPTIDWTRFDQGDVSDQMWTAFRHLIQLCHCVEHWRESHRALSLTRPPAPLYTPESRHYRKKRLDEWKRPSQAAENHMHRAAHLADDKVAEMSWLVSPHDQGKPDWRLYFASALSIGRSLGHLRARYKSVAFDQFASNALSDADPSRTASQWLERAGLTDQRPML